MAYAEEAGAEAMPPEYYSGGGGVTSKIKNNLEGIVPLILIIIIVAFIGDALGFWEIPFISSQKPINMLIIGAPSYDTAVTLNNIKNIVRYQQRDSTQFTVNPEEVLAQYDIVMLDQHTQANKEISIQLGDAIKKYVNKGGKFILVMDSGIREKGAYEVIGWGATMGDIVPVACTPTGETNEPSCTQLIRVLGVLKRDKFDHPIMKYIEQAPPQGEGQVLFETFPVEITGDQLAYIERSGQTGDWYPGIVEKKLYIGKSIYFNYDPGKTPGIFERTIKYLAGKS